MPDESRERRYGDGTVHPTVHTPGPTVSRGTLARMLGVSVTQIRRREENRSIVPTSLDSLGRAHYALDYARDLVKKSRAKKVTIEGEKLLSGKDVPLEFSPPGELPREETAGELASRVFTALDSGKSPAAIVVELKMAPSLVKKLVEDWTEMSHVVVLREEHLRAISSLGLEGTYPVTSADELLENLREVAEERRPKPTIKEPLTTESSPRSPSEPPRR